MLNSQVKATGSAGERLYFQVSLNSLFTSTGMDICGWADTPYRDTLLKRTSACQLHRNGLLKKIIFTVEVLVRFSVGPCGWQLVSLSQ